MNREELLGDLKRIRVNNNDLWMKILEIAITADPMQTKKVMAQISVNDQKVVDTFLELAATSS